MKNPKSALQCTSGGLHAAYYYQYYYQDLDSILPTAAKIVRLGFHDCLPEKDTGAGCNGCLNLKGVGNRYFIYKGCENPTTDYIKYLCKYYEGDLRPQVQNETDNNNLFWVAAVLEDVYKNSLYGGVQSSQSLFDAGIWAYHYATKYRIPYIVTEHNQLSFFNVSSDKCELITATYYLAIIKPPNIKVNETKNHLRQQPTCTLTRNTKIRLD